MQRLQIYNASAGSGKTFTLALEYIKLLVKSPQKYRSILAVTFTNKATAEMKERILSQLYGIAFSLSDSDSYFQCIKKDLNLEEKVIRERCKIALHNILHDFSFFHVETIDSFFQMIIRNLAHELQLSNNINLDLDQQSAIDEAVDNLIENLTLDSPIISWILEYIQERIDENSSWNITRKLKQFGKDVYNDTYQNYAGKLEENFNAGLYKNYKHNLQKAIDAEEDRLKSYASTFMDLVAENQLEMDDFKYKDKSGAIYFQKILNGQFGDDIVTSRTLQFMEDANAWPGSDKAKKSLIIQLAETQWIPLMNETEKARSKANRLINTKRCLRRHFNDLQLLSSIHRQLREENSRNNRLLLAETPLLLNKLIDDSDAPFIFEKIGTRLEHIMIDEFQDTSRMQWNNFKSLLIECLSKGNSSLIVGDIKQSIYRWRNGDWSILGNIRAELPHLGEIESTPLYINRRSLGNIIGFNNDFFTDLLELMKKEEEKENLPALIGNVYKDVIQDIKPENQGQGYVHITLINENNPNRPEEYKTETIKEVANTIQMLRENGAELNDIAILVRAKSPIPEIASYFAKNLKDIPIVSAEAFLLNASEAVCTIIDALRYLNDQTDTLAVTQLARVYQNKILGNSFSLDQLCETADKAALLPEGFTANLKVLKLLPLYELIENIIQLFQIQKLEKQEAYVFYFLDQVMEFLSKEPGDILAFLSYWEETLKDKKIPAGKINGVQVHSIHASKGLEFQHVIIPYCDWDMVRYRNVTLWTETHSDDPQELPVAPVDFGKEMKESDFQEEYNKELQQQWIDNINLLYVAFTRPKANLFILGRRPKKNKNGTYPNSSVSALLFNVLKEKGTEEEKQQKEDEDFTRSFGELSFNKEQKDTSENPLLAVPTETQVKLQSNITHVEFRQSNKSQQFIESEDIPENQEYIQQGLILHSLFSSIKTVDDVDAQLQKYEFDGVIGSNLTQKRIAQLVHNALENKTAKDWFSGSWTVINECDILQHTPQGMKAQRPDRVMIKDDKVMVVDFKFGKPKPEHQKQVRGYMELLLRMGYQNVEGCLWYVYKNKIEPVTL